MAPPETALEHARDRLTGHLHLAVALLSLWLVATSPWVSMYRRVPGDAGALELVHVAGGFIAVLLSATYLYACARDGQWRLYFPWLAGRLGVARRDLAGLLRGRIPPAEGGGLFAAIEGLTLLALLATGLTGAAWFFCFGSAEALAWRGYHVICARALIGFGIAHILTVSLHLLEFVRD